MKAILSALKTQLPAAVASIRDIEVIPNENMLPESARMPFVGLKDGDIVGDDGLDPLTRYYVHAYCYVEIAKPEASVMGDGVLNGKIGILDFTDAVAAGLRTIGKLGITDIISMDIDPNQQASETGQADEGFIQRKKLTVWYTRNE